MRVLACYAYNDVRDEEWPRGSKIPEGCARISVRAVILDSRERERYLKGAYGEPALPGSLAAGIVADRGDTDLEPGTPVIAWRERGWEGQGLASEFALVPRTCLLPLAKALDYVSMAALPLWARVRAALPGEGAPDAPCAVCGTGSCAAMARELLRTAGRTVTEAPGSAGHVIVANASGPVLDRACALAAPGAAVAVLSASGEPAWSGWPLALQKGLCFNFNSAFAPADLQAVLDLALGQAIRPREVLQGSLDWDHVEKAFALLEKEGDAVALYTGRAEEPYYP